MDYSLPAQSLSVTFTSMTGDQFCIDISAIEDTIGEDTEQFELYFENLPSASALAGDPDVLCVNILDNESESSSIMLMPFSQLDGSPAIMTILSLLQDLV